ncbi:Rieske 2Fe-2S domain-containing protein [Chamaesiphon sp. VAR_69_metabat_338]|uniref:QcrA and Rieske domain-containing protein n=1 Tax=Chamaesiphon sp. VAR_69_metabat_338 TaxID=2964704 RepID=UPI00286E624B|nr:Rieske 2Fe-2S domain-containing protein [Chamaesiphon sp. VAR_69_metabat_338]
MVKRRSFLGYFGIGWLTACFPVVLAACAPTKSTTQIPNKPAEPIVEPKGTATPAAAQTTEGFTAIGTVADLEQNGYLQTKEVAITKNPANPQQLLAVNPKCTHQGCIVKWIASEKKYDCPCHDAEFAADGQVVKGPAKEALATYSAKIVGTQVMVKI